MDVLRRADFALDALDELVELLERVGVAERQHREPVPNGAELARQVAAHAHRRGVGVGQLGMGAFELLEFAHQGVEFEIGDLGRILDVVLEIMIFELPAQLLDSFGYHI